MKKRRDLLKLLSVAGAAGAVEVWKKPVVESVLLPAHAITTGETCFGSFTLNPPQTASIFDLLVAPVYASHLTGDVNVWLCIAPLNGTANVEALVQATNGSGEPVNVSRYTDTIPIDGNPHDLSPPVTLCNTGGDCDQDTKPITFLVSINPGISGHCTGRIDSTWDGVDFNENENCIPGTEPALPSGGSYDIPVATCSFPDIGSSCVS